MKSHAAGFRRTQRLRRRRAECDLGGFGRVRRIAPRLGRPQRELFEPRLLQRLLDPEAEDAAVGEGACTALDDPEAEE